MSPAVPTIENPGAATPHLDAFWVRRDGLRSGPHTLQALRAMAVAWQLLPDDTIEFADTGQQMDAAPLLKCLRHLEPHPVLLRASPEILLTRESVVAKERVFSIRDLTRVDLLLPEPPRQKVLSRMDHTLIWTLGLLFVWTIIGPVVAWYLTRPTFKEQGLGAVHGIRLSGGFGECVVCDGLGMLREDDPRRQDLAEIAAQIEDCRRSLNAASG